MFYRVCFVRAIAPKLLLMESETFEETCVHGGVYMPDYIACAFKKQPFTGNDLVKEMEKVVNI